MISRTFRENCRKTWLILGSIIWVSISTAYGANLPAKSDPNEWKKVVEAAKKEGKIIISGSPSQEWRKSLVDMFREEYPEIAVDSK